MKNLIILWMAIQAGTAASQSLNATQQITYAWTFRICPQGCTFYDPIMVGGALCGIGYRAPILLKRQKALRNLTVGA